MKIQKGIQSGTLGATVSVNSKYGQVVRTRPRQHRQDKGAAVLARQLRSLRPAHRPTAGGLDGADRKGNCSTPGGYSWQQEAPPPERTGLT
jgi:hypothetical protein